MTLCLLMVGFAFLLNWTSMLTLFWLCMFMFTFSLGLGPVTFVVASEVCMCIGRANRLTDKKKSMLANAKFLNPAHSCVCLCVCMCSFNQHRPR